MGTEREFDAIAADAISGSEKEFFAEAMGHNDAGTDSDGDTSLETMGKGLEGQHEGGEDEEEGKEGEAPEPEAKAEGETEEAKATRERGEDGRFKPKGEERQDAPDKGIRGELSAEREKRRAAEVKAQEVDGLRTQLATLQQQIAALSRQPAPQPPAPAKEEPKEEVPDRWSDPEGYDKWLEARILRQVEARQETANQQRVSHSFDEARGKHGDAFEAAFRALDALPPDHPQTKAVVDYIMKSPNPGEAAMMVYRRSQAQREIGADPVAFRDKVQAEARDTLMKDPEFRKQVFEAIQAEARQPAGGGGPRTATQLPPSLSSARGGPVSRQFAGSSDGELFDDVMSR